MTLYAAIDVVSAAYDIPVYKVSFHRIRTDEAVLFILYLYVGPTRQRKIILYM